MKLRPLVIGDLLESAATRYPEKEAIRYRDEAITYGALFDEALKMKGLIRSMGIQKGDRVGIYLDKSIGQLTAMFAASMAGTVFVFINPVLKKGQIEYIINDCQIELLICSRDLIQRSQLALPRQAIYLDDDPASALAADHTAVPVNSADIACLIYTSGSTGMPKGVVVPHRTVVEGAEIVGSYLDITERDRIISVLPFNFDYGLNQATSAVLHGATLVLHQFVLVKDLLDVLVAEQITGLAGMPPIWSKIFSDKFKLTAGLDFPHLRYLTNSGGKVPRVMVDRIRAYFPKARLFLMYGLTEAFRSTFLPPEELDRRPNSIGKAIPNVEILVVNGNGDECAPGEEGELVHRGALVTLGYWNDQDKTNAVFRKSPRLAGQAHLHEVVVYSGDVVKKDEEGFLYFVSRNDEMIKASGFRISPTEVEEAIIGLPGVGSVVVFGQDTGAGDQIIVAVLEADDLDDQKAEILKECRKRLPGHMVPHALHFEREFPKTANGKVDRASIKSKWISCEDVQ